MKCHMNGNDYLKLSSLFRPGTYGLDRFVVKRYVEQVLSQSERWKQLAPYFTKISPSIRAYPLTSYEVELTRRILDFHLSDKLHLRVTQLNDQLIAYEDLVDFSHRAQELYGSNSYSPNHIYSTNGKKISIPSIPSIHSSYTLPPPPPIKPVISPPSQSEPSPVKPPPPPIAAAPLPQSNKSQTTNGHHTSQSSNQSTSHLVSKPQIKLNSPSSAGIHF
jgi:hypothetical protein